MKWHNLLQRFVRLPALALGAALLTTGLQAAALKPFRVGYNNWVGYIALFVAQDKGYFKKAGLDVQTKMFSSPGDGLAPLLTGDLDLHFSTADSVITALDKAPGQLKIVYLIDCSAGADAIIAKDDIASVADLKGKTVAATVGQCNHLLLIKALEQSGLKPADIKLINMNPDDAGAAFAAGKLDAAATWEPWLTQITDQKKGHIIFSSKQTPDLILDCLVISTRTAKEKAPEIRAFLHALNQANEFVIAHPKQAAVIGAKALEQKPADVLAMLPKVRLFGRKANLKQMAGPAVKVGQELAVFFKQQKVNDTMVDVSDLYDPSYLK